LKRLALLLAALAALAGALSVYWVGGRLAAPAPRAVGDLPADLAGHALKVPSPAAGVLKGWLLPGRREGGAVLLLHGLRASRLDMLSRARFLHALGYTVMLFDSRAHGESGGQRITFGYMESIDARTLLGALRQAAPGEPLGVIGVSLGGAAVLVGPQPLRVHALVLESVYPTLEEAIDNRLAIRLGPLGPPLAPLLTVQLRPRLGFGLEDLRPIDSVDRVGAALLVIAGTEDRHTTIVQSRRLFARAQAPKEMWEVPGAGHVDYHRAAPADYEARVGGFLGRHLRDGPARISRE
jgi:pimeloyl-ACP methyl ester carboxylesterase